MDRFDSRRQWRLFLHSGRCFYNWLGQWNTLLLVRGFGEMVFAVNPDTCCEYYVYPLAKNFSDFLRLILATKNTNTMQQIILWNKQQYHDFISSPDEIKYHAKKEVKDALEAIRGLGILPMAHPFEYIKNIQTGFNYTQIPFSDEFYDVTGLEKPQ